MRSSSGLACSPINHLHKVLRAAPWVCFVKQLNVLSVYGPIAKYNTHFASTSKCTNSGEVVYKLSSDLPLFRLGGIHMSLSEMSLSEQEKQGGPGDEVYDDGYLRVEHKNYYVACGGTPLKLPRTEFLIFSRLSRTPDRIVTAGDLWV